MAAERPVDRCASLNESAGEPRARSNEPLNPLRFFGAQAALARGRAALACVGRILVAGEATFIALRPDRPRFGAYEIYEFFVV